jgi:hypothetical protein
MPYEISVEFLVEHYFIGLMPFTIDGALGLFIIFILAILSSSNTVLGTYFTKKAYP